MVKVADPRVLLQETMIDDPKLYPHKNYVFISCGSNTTHSCAGCFRVFGVFVKLTRSCACKYDLCFDCMGKWVCQNYNNFSEPLFLKCMLCKKHTTFTSREDIELWTVTNLRDDSDPLVKNINLAEFTKILNQRMYKNIDETTQYLSDIEMVKQQFIEKLKELENERTRLMNQLRNSDPLLSIANQTLSDPMDQD